MRGKNSEDSFELAGKSYICGILLYPITKLGDEYEDVPWSKGSIEKEVEEEG